MGDMLTLREQELSQTCILSPRSCHSLVCSRSELVMFMVLGIHDHKLKQYSRREYGLQRSKQITCAHEMFCICLYKCHTIKASVGIRLEEILEMKNK